MGIRRRRRKLSTLMSRLDQRVRAVELRPVSLLTSSEVAAAIETGQPLVGPETAVGASAPWQFIKVQDGYVYPKALTGNTNDRVELYTEADIGAEVGDRVEVSGVHWASSSQMDVTGNNFVITNIDTSDDWSGRPSYKHDPTQDQLSGVTITHAYELVPESSAPQTWTSRKRLQTRRKVDSFEISAAPNSTVTLTMNATHHFEVGDIVFVDIFSEDSRAYGVDGLFEISAVTSTTIEYVLTAGVDTAVNSTDVSSADVYVHPVIRDWAQDGSIWIDSSNNEQYYWDGIRWVDYTPGTSVGQDGDPPSPVTSLSASSTAELAPTTYEPYAEVTLSWTAPTTSASGDPITDLAGYKIRWRRTALEDWRPWISLLDPSATSYVFDSDSKLSQGQLYYFEVVAIDTGLQPSTAASTSHTTSITAGDHTVYPPTDPTATSRLGTITVTWNGRLNTGISTIAAPDSIISLNVHMSTTNGFTPSSATLVEKVRVFGGLEAFAVVTDLNYSTPYYFRITVSDTAGVESSPSGQVTAQVQPLVDADIVNSTLSNWPFNGGVVPAGALASGAINASTMFGNDVVVQSAIAANAIGANEIAAGAIIAGKIGANAVTAATIAAGSISADKITTNAVTADKINAGSITAVKIASDAITAEKIDAGAITADAIAAQAITAAKLESDLTLSNLIKTGDAGTARIEIRGKDHANPGIVSFNGGGGTAFRFYSNGLSYLDDVIIESGGQITAGSTTIQSGFITGGTLRTASSGKRVEMRGGTSQDIRFVDSNNTERGSIDATTTGLSMTGSGTEVRLSTNTINIRTSGISRLTAIDSGVVLGTAPTTAAAANLRRPSGSEVLAVFSSDLRIKENVVPISEGLSVINNLNPVTFNSRVDNTDKMFSGFLAQEVQNIFSSTNFTVVTEEPGIVPDTADADPEDFAANPLLSINHVELIAYLTKAIQELDQKNKELESRIQGLESSGGS